MKKNQTTGKKDPQDARHEALLVLDHLCDSSQTLDAILDQTRHRRTDLSKKDRSFFNALVYSTIRNRGKLDRVIGHFSKTPVKRIQMPVMNILRLSLSQVIFMDRVPVSAAVNTAVEMAKKKAAPWTVKFVNGLLRTASKKYPEMPIPSLADDVTGYFLSEKSIPPWLSRRWATRFGVQETGMLCDLINTPPSITVRCNRLKTTRSDLFKALEREALALQRTTVSTDGIRFSKPICPVFEMKAFKKGWFQVQDEAAQLVTELLRPEPGDTVLDACAGLGGKTGHMAQLMENRGRIMAMDSAEGKLSKLNDAMQRLGTDIVEPVMFDLNQKPAPSAYPRFDKILMDAPCSGLGVLRRNPDAKWSLGVDDIKRCAKRQLAFLNHLGPLVKPGGVLGYSVCSFEPEENEQVINHFLKNNTNFAIKPTFHHLGDGVTPLIEKNGCFRTFPHRHQMDGFFAAFLIKSK